MARITKTTTFSDGQVPTAGQFNTNFDQIFNEFNGNIDNNNIKGTAAISGTKLADNSIDATKLGTSAITQGYAEVTASQSGITNIVDLTGLSVTVAVPAGGRKVKITAEGHFRSTVANDVVVLELFEGSTVLQQCVFPIAAANTSQKQNMHYISTPTAGNHTYKLTLKRSSGTGSISSIAGSATPAFILVEAV